MTPFDSTLCLLWETIHESRADNADVRKILLGLRWAWQDAFCAIARVPQPGLLDEFYQNKLECDFLYEIALELNKEWD